MSQPLIANSQFFMLTHRFPALATRDARIFFAGQFPSPVGTWMQNTVQPYVA